MQKHSQNESLKAYAYAPKNQKEIDDIFTSQSLHKVWFFAPVLVDEPAKGAAPVIQAPAPAAAPAPAPANPEAAEEIARLTKLLRVAETTIGTLRADLKAQQEKTAQASAPKGKPGRKPKANPEPAVTPSDSDIPTE